MSLEGNLASDSLTEVLSAIDTHRRTGILTVQGNREIVAISFLNGQVVSADALNQSLEDGLGSVLADLGLVAPDDFAGLAAEYQAGGGRVVELVVERGFVSRRGLLAALRVHTYRLCLQALAWSEGEFKFYLGEEVSFEHGATPIPVAELLSRAAGDLGDSTLAGRSFPGPDSVFGRRPDAAFDDGFDWPAESAELGIEELTEEAREVFARLNGVSSVGEIADATGVPDFRVTYFLHRWWQEGLVDELEQRRPEPAPPEAAPDIELSEPEIERLAQPARPGALVSMVRRLLQAGSPAFAEPGPALTRALGLLLLVALVASAVQRPEGLLTEAQATVPDQPAVAASPAESPALERIRHATTVFFLLHGHYPEDLERLVELRLLDPRDLGEPEERFELSSTAVSYAVRRVSAAAVAERAATETIVGNFLLDPDFGHGDRSEIPLLVLLD